MLLMVVAKNDRRTEFPPVSVPRTSFHTESEEFIEEEDQSQHVPFGQPPHLAFPDHVHYLISLDRPPCPVKGSEPLAGIDPSFDRSMILFHDIVQVRTGTTATPTTKFALQLQFRHNLGIGRVAVDVDHPGPRVTRGMQGVLEETLGGSSIPPGSEPEIDRRAGRVDGPVQVG